MSFFKFVKTQFGKSVKRIRSDNGLEFDELLREFCDDNGIFHETSCVDNPQQNGRVERKHRNILKIVRALYFEAYLPIELWGECVSTAAYLINRTPIVLMKSCLGVPRVTTILNSLGAFAMLIIILL